MADNMNKELFLDILTKEEKEALLTKKMEEIRKKNDALRKRHEEIEADKRVAAKNNPNKDVNSYTREASSSGSSSPQKESKSLPGEDRRGPRPKSGGRGKSQVGGKSKEKKPQGPPPDPSYNFLADRRREGPGKESNGEPPVEKVRKSDTRRHPKNYGGQDFNNVKTQMRTTKERQERPKSGPPRTKMELAMAMTGKERKQYLEWKAERDRVDQERMDRQKSTSGEWRRAWDADKNQQDFEQPSSPQRTEPAKRPAGRIGSGRFDRGEREERQRGDAPRLKAGVKQEQDVQTKPVGRGRARGRGRGRGRGDRSPRQRTFSSGDESRKVERQKDLLVVKIDNSGKETNQSVEVEYWDDDMMDVKSNSAASVRSGTSSRDGHSNHARRRRDDHQFDDPDEGQDGDDNCVGGHQRRHTQSHSLGDENEHDESWEDCPEDSEFYADDDYADGDDRYKEPLKLECKLNPDAPEFTPTSPEFMKTPPGHVKVMDWVTEVNSNLSPTSPSPTMDGVNNEECKRALSKSNSSGKSSSHGGVTKNGTKFSEEELSASYIDEKETHDSAAPEAPEEFLDASGDVGDTEISQLSSEEGGNEPESKSNTVGSCEDVKGVTDSSTQNTEVSTVHKDKVIDEAQSGSNVDGPSEPQGNNETIANNDGAVGEIKEVNSHVHSRPEISLKDQPLPSGETGISVTATPMNPATDAVKVESSSVEPTADATAVEPTENVTTVEPTADATAVANATAGASTTDSTAVNLTADVASVEQTADFTAGASTTDSTAVNLTADVASVEPVAETASEQSTQQMAKPDMTPLTDKSDQSQSNQLVQEEEPTVDSDQKSSESEGVVAAESKTTIPTTTTATAESSHVE